MKQLKRAGVCLVVLLGLSGHTASGESAGNGQLCLEMLLRGQPFSVIVDHKKDGMVERIGHMRTTCAEPGSKVQIVWSDYLGLFPMSWKEYYPRRLREPVPTWYWIGTLNHFEPPDLKKAFEILVAEGQVQINMSYQYDSEAFQCDQTGANCERETEHDEFESKTISFQIVERKSLTIGSEEYPVWVIDWYYGRIIYSPEMRIPLRIYEYSIDQKDPSPQLVNEVISVHR